MPSMSGARLGAARGAGNVPVLWAVGLFLLGAVLGGVGARLLGPPMAGGKGTAPGAVPAPRVDKLDDESAGRILAAALSNYPVRALGFHRDGWEQAQTFEVVVPAEQGAPLPFKLGQEDQVNLSLSGMPPVGALQMRKEQYFLTLKTPLEWKIDRLAPVPADPGRSVSLAFSARVAPLPRSAPRYFQTVADGTVSLKQGGGGWVVDRIEAPLLPALSKE